MNDYERAIKRLYAAVREVEWHRTFFLSDKMPDTDPALSETERAIILDLAFSALYSEKPLETQINEMRDFWEAEEKAQNEAYEETYGKTKSG